VIDLDVLGPFQVRKRPLVLKPVDAKPDTGSARAGPLAWWKFDETNGTRVANAAGTQFHGLVQGPPRWTGGGDGHRGVLEFDGDETWVDCPDSARLELRDRLSVSAWFKVRSSDPASQTLLAKGEAWRLQRLADKGTIEFALVGPQTKGASKGKLPTVVSKRTVADEQWHHVAGTYDGERIVLYLDGVEEGAVTASGPVAVNTAPVTIGENAVTRGRFFNGWLDDARLYDRGLSAGEIRKLSEDRGE
jgi:hypothetical protein